MNSPILVWMLYLNHEVSTLTEECEKCYELIHKTVLHAKNIPSNLFHGESLRLFAFPATRLGSGAACAPSRGLLLLELPYVRFSPHGNALPETSSSAFQHIVPAPNTLAEDEVLAQDDSVPKPAPLPSPLPPAGGILARFGPRCLPQPSSA
ncbi:hypothetical protein V8E53_004503 [Lactarius tabidus]